MTISASARSVLFALAFFAVTLLPDSHSATAYAQDDMSAMPGEQAADDGSAVPDEVVDAVQSLFRLPGDRDATFDPAAVAPLLDYVRTARHEEQDLPAYEGASGAMIRETFDTGLKRILRYAYNPDIPAYLFLPSVVRLSGWYPGSDILTHDKLWKLVDDLDGGPLVLHGKEFEEITPDLFSGGYYRYDLDRTLVLMRHEGRAVLISISTQDGLSEVGKKGVVLDEGNWQYFYSGEDGLTTGGIGWMDTYLYGSWSVSVFMEQPGEPARTTNVVFKWLRAGWARMNVVRSKHILAGCRRFADAFRQVMGSAQLPGADELAAKASEVLALTDDELDARIREYAAALERAYADHPVIEDDFVEVLQNGSYADHLSRQQRVGTLLLEYLKSRLGTQCLPQG